MVQIRFVAVTLPAVFSKRQSHRMLMKLRPRPFLKLRLNRMDRRVGSQKVRSDSNENSLDINAPNSPQSSNSSNLASSDSHSNNKTADLENVSNNSIKIRLNTSGGVVTAVKQDFSIRENESGKGNSVSLGEWPSGGKKKRKSELLLLTGAKRNRGVSSSSNMSNDTTSSLQGIKSLVQDKSLDKKDKAFKKESFLTTEEHYYTAVGDLNFSLCLKASEGEDDSNNLEVPSWRVKQYTSCYSMEGTENLEDEIFNKRHLKLENDEKRRKRWDAQRIREQRHIEKLKQRQEKQNHHAACLNTSHVGPCQATLEEETVTSLWPDIDQIQSIQVDDMLPICAFGELVPAMEASTFSIPWLTGKKKSRRRAKRLTGIRRKSNKR